MNKNFAFMAFASGSESTEGGSIKRYIGVAPVFVLAVNPNKNDMEKLLNINLDEAPSYVGEADTADGKKVPTARITFFVKPDPAKIGMDVAPISVTMFLRREARVNKDNTKVQVIDKYGRTAWPTWEEAKVKATTLTKNDGSTYEANIDKDYRPAYIGEAELVDFLKCYLNIPNIMIFNSKTREWSKNPNEKDCEAMLECIENYFKGDFTELQNILKLQPKNKVKVLFGVRTTDDNKQYQAAYTQKFLKNNVNDYSKLDKEIQDRIADGGLSNIEYEVCDFKEYTVESTDLTSPASDMPFPSADMASTPWAR